MSAALFSSDLTLHDSFSCACVIVKLVDWLKALIIFKYLMPRVRFAACNLLVNHPGFAVQLYFACNSSNQSDCRRRTYNGRSASNFIFNDWANGLELDWMQQKNYQNFALPAQNPSGDPIKEIQIDFGENCEKVGQVGSTNSNFSNRKISNEKKNIITSFRSKAALTST